MPVDPQLRHLVLERLTASDALRHAAMELVAAACMGSDAVEDTLAGNPPRNLLDTEAEAAPKAPHVFLERITAEGFRGIGPRAELALSPGPGLTVVVGRNGTGKSSFAEAAELALTGRNRRWDGRSTVDWRDGLHNLHASGGAQVAIALTVEGQKTPVRVSRSWPPDAQGEAEADVRGAGAATTLESLGWAGPAASYRPFISYSELGQTFDLKPGDFHDRLSGVLGLEALDDALALLAGHRKSLDGLVKEANNAHAGLCASLGASADQRARDALTALAAEPWDLEALDLIGQGLSETGAPETELQRLQGLAALEVPDIESVNELMERAVAAARRLAEIANTDAATAAQTAQVLAGAVALHDSHNAEACPVCGTTGALSEAWAETARNEIMVLNGRAAAFKDATDGCAAARRELDGAFTRPPAALDAPDGLGLDVGPAAEAWGLWVALRAESLDTVTVEAAPRLATLHARVRELANAAQAEVDRRNQEWLPLGRQIVRWLPLAAKAAAARVQLPDAKAAESWLKSALGELRRDRFAPISEAAEQNWQTIRQSSHVALKGISLEGAATRRRVHISVAVDGTDAGALGVMSQGELHAIALSLFLPRATLDESPFRFVVVDDPVQAMDGLRVDGLARVLHATAKHRQVVVFTHDDRLAAALRRLDLPFTHIEVTRREGSAVSAHRLGDPVTTLLDDARAVARTDGLPPEHGALACLGICRSAIEAACQAVIARRRIARGDDFAAVEALLTSERRLNQWVALAVLDDEAGTDRLLPRVTSQFGRRASDALLACNAASHGDATRLIGPLASFVQTVEAFTGRILVLS